MRPWTPSPTLQKLTKTYASHTNGVDLGKCKTEENVGGEEKELHNESVRTRDRVQSKMEKNKNQRAGMVAHTCNPKHLGG